MSSRKKIDPTHTKRHVARTALAAALTVASMTASSLLAASELINLSATEPKAEKSLASLSTSKFRPARAGKPIKDQYIVVLKDQYVDREVNRIASRMGIASSSSAASDLKRQAVMNTVQNMAGSYGMEIKQSYHSALSGFVTKGDKLSIKNLMLDERVAFVEPDQIMTTTATQRNVTWGLDRIDQANLPLNTTYNYNFDGSGVQAYVIDTGVLASHRDFGNRVRSGYSAINDGRGSNDCNGHGTHVAGTIGSRTYGVAKNVTLYPVRVLDCNGTGANSGVIAGVDWVARNASRPAVANMSLGGGSSSALDNAVNSAIDRGITFVVAAGNSNSNACNGSPNRVPRALTIANSTWQDRRASTSSWGPCIDMFAPGTQITSTWSNGGTRTISGTSMASPHVAGVAALYLDANPSATPSQVESVLESAAVRNKISDTRQSPNLLLQSDLNGGGGPTPPPIDGSVSNLSVGQGQSINNYVVNLEDGYSQLTISTSGGRGDADLYINRGSRASRSNYDCKSEGSNNNESCTINNPASGTWYITIYGYRASSGITLRAVAR